MKRLLLAAALILALAWTPFVPAIGPRGGGGRGGARPAAPRPSPSMSAARPAPARPSGGFVPQARPNVQRPSAPNVQRPNFQAGQRPNLPNMQRPNIPNTPRPNIANLPRPTTPNPGNRPGGLVPQRPPGMGGPAIGSLPGTAGIRPRPGQLPAVRPGVGGITGVNRPDLGRPGIGPGGVRPGGIAGTRPGGNFGNIGNTVIGGGNNVFNRPNIGGGNTVINRPNIGSGNQIIRPDITTNIGINRIGVNRPGWNRPGWGNGVTLHSGAWASAGAGVAAAGTWGGGWAGGGAARAWGGNWGYGGAPRYYHGAYGRWYRGAWSGWRSYPSVWLGGGAALGWLGATAAQSYFYSNPYVVPSTVGVPIYDYAQPLPVYAPTQPDSSPIIINLPPNQPAESSASAAVPGLTALPAEPPAPQEPEAPQDPKVKEAVGLFDQARDLFLKNDYAGAQAHIDKAITVLPQDRVLHEFRALVLFAEGKYPEAASTLYAVLAAGPGWNWDTVKTFYPDTTTYTNQLRALEAHAGKNLQAADDRFILAYQYLVLGQTDAAITVLEQVTRLQPQDQLSVAMLQALKPKPLEGDDRPQPKPG